MNYLQKKKLAFMSIVNRVKGFIRTVTGVLPLTLEGCVDDESIIDYTLYGQSVQNGTPTPETPVEVESVGEKTRNLFNPKQTPVQIGNYLVMTLESDIYTLRIALKNNKNVPSGVYFGLIYGSNASWLIANGNVQQKQKSLDLSTYTGIGVAVYSASGNKKAWNNMVDAFDIYLSEGYETTYEPYGYKIPVKVSGNGESITTNIYLDEPLRKVGNYADYIKSVDLVNGTGTVVRRVYECNMTEVFNTLNIKAVIYGKYTDVIRFSHNLNTMKCKLGKANCKTISNRFISANADSFKDDKECVFFHSDLNTHFYTSLQKDRLGIGETDTDSEILNKHAEYVKNNDTKVYYALATPTETPITLPTIPTFKGTSIISADTTIQPSNAEITYYSNVKE